MGGIHERQISKPQTPYPLVSISANNHNTQIQRLGKVRLVAALADLKFGVYEKYPFQTDDFAIKTTF